MANYIKAPFNFVPLNKEVFYPDWADRVSQDIPFSDGESGTIELEITAKSPVFVRNGHTREDAEAKNETYCSFSKDTAGKYFIPGTSIKGMLRNVMEIISFGKMSKISDDRFGFRDLHNPREYMSVFQSDRVHCGYLRKISEDVIEISDHDIPLRLSHKEIDDNLNTGLCGFFGDKSNFRNHEERKTAWFKYDRFFRGKKLTGTFREISSSSQAKVDNRKFVSFDPQGNIAGEIVLTGQPSVREKKYNYKKGKDTWTGKFYEFVFPAREISNININTKETRSFRDFLFIHKDSYDWSDFRKKQFERGEDVPIFFVKDKDGKILHWGLSYLYKIPYKHTIKDGLSDNHKDKGNDLPGIIFGDHDYGLKGRVQISHAYLVEGGPDVKKSPLMGSPKASYYPIYIRQDEINGDLKGPDYVTYHSSSFVLKGWKRYPVHQNISEFKQIEPGQLKNASPFIPLKENSRFKMKIRFHNLKPEEIGALLLSIKLKDSKSYHSIGFAKPYGYGKLKLEIMSNNLQQEETYYEEVFKNSIRKSIPNWETSPQLQEFYLMAAESLVDNKLEYMELNEFADAKSQKKSGQRLVLPYYSDYSGVREKKVNPGPARLEQVVKQKPIPQVITTASESAAKVEEVVIQPDWIKAKITGEKKVALEGYDYPIFLYIPMEKRNLVLRIGNFVWVKIKQTKKDGQINQVELIRLV